MTKARVKNIVKWKEENGPFICREQIKSVKGIGPKLFEQFAGFVRVMPETSGAPVKKYFNQLRYGISCLLV